MATRCTAASCAFFATAEFLVMIYMSHYKYHRVQVCSTDRKEPSVLVFGFVRVLDSLGTTEHPESCADSYPSVLFTIIAVVVYVTNITQV